MTAYVDASVVLRLALGQPNALPEWRHIEQGVSTTGERLAMATHDVALAVAAQAHGLTVVGART